MTTNATSMATYLIQRDFTLHQTSQTVNDGAVSDRPGRVEICIHLRPGASKVKQSRPSVLVDGNSQLDGGAIVLYHTHTHTNTTTTTITM
jgi:hypothetical protein